MTKTRLDALMIAESEAQDDLHHAEHLHEERRKEEAAARARTNLAAERIEVLRIEAEAATVAREEAEIAMARKQTSGVTA